MVGVGARRPALLLAVINFSKRPNITPTLHSKSPPPHHPMRPELGDSGMTA